MDNQIQRMKVLGAGIFSLLLALGVARFAYTPLLPVMQAQAGLGLAEGGWLAAAPCNMSSRGVMRLNSAG